jgi:hypothetical protein
MINPSLRLPAYLAESYPFPNFYCIRRVFPGGHLTDPVGAVQQAVGRQLDHIGAQAGQRVCLGVGSRGIRHIDQLVGAVVAVLKQRGIDPFVIPAMGSHGGATPDGQVATLRALGITEASCGCPIVSSFDTELIGQVHGEVPIHFSRDALEADFTIGINRIKPHTKFTGPIESGLLKMLCIGLGKHEGALVFHHWALKYGFYPLMAEMGRVALERSNYRFGIAVVENADDNIMLIEGLAGEELIEGEKRLLETAKAHLPRLPVTEADVLVVGYLGKEISGAGMDPNITGRAADLMEDDFSGNFRSTRLAVLNLTPASRGNALGIGNADFITRKIFDDLDYEATLMNTLTGISIRKAAIPVIMPTDEKAIQACFNTLGPKSPPMVRAIIIRDTLHLAECWVSEAIYPSLAGRGDIVSATPVKLSFDEMGNLEWLKATG